MRSKRTIRIVLAVLLGGLTLLTPVKPAEADIGTGTTWAYYEATARWEEHVANGSFNIVLYPLGHHDDTALYSYEIRGDVRVPSTWCTGDTDIAYVSADTTGSYAFDAPNESYGGPLTGNISWRCWNNSHSGNAPFRFDFSISPDEPSSPGPCLGEYEDVFQVCDDRRARVGMASWCWASGIGCASPTTPIYPGKLFGARVFKAAGTVV